MSAKDHYHEVIKNALLLEDNLLRIVSFDPEKEEIVKWMT
jgi:hypothetical protein